MPCFVLRLADAAARAQKPADEWLTMAPVAPVSIASRDPRQPLANGLYPPHGTSGRPLPERRKSLAPPDRKV